MLQKARIRASFLNLTENGRNDPNFTVPRSSVSPVSGSPIDLVRSRVSQDPDIGPLLRHIGRLVILLTWI